jgi:hypothetical protein
MKKIEEAGFVSLSKPNFLEQHKGTIWHYCQIRTTFSFPRVAPRRQQQDLLLRTPFVPQSAT